MEVKLEVVQSSSIKRRKPWPAFCWLGQEKESVFLLDDKRISEINLVSGRTKKKIPKLQPLLRNVITMSGSGNGAWLAGLLSSGELFLWNRDRDCLKMVASAPEVTQVVTDSQESSVRLSLVVSGDGKRVLLAMVTGLVFLWESTTSRDMTTAKDPSVKGRWSQILPGEGTVLPTHADKEVALHGRFIQEEATGDCCLCSFVFTSEEKLAVTILKIQWGDSAERSHSVQWVTQMFPMGRMTPPCHPVKSRGALVSAFSGDGLVLAVAVNQKDPKATQVFFVSTLNFVTISSSLHGCGSKDLRIPCKYARSYWVGSMSWTPDGLYLACVLKRGALLFVTRLGALLTLSTTGCSMEFGPAEFIPLHPLVTFRPPMPQLSSQDAQQSASSCASAQDLLRQRFSVTAHPRLSYLIVSDGYMASVLRVASPASASSLMACLLADTASRLEQLRSGLAGTTQPHERLKLESMSSLKMLSLQDLRPRESTLTTVPHFLLGADVATELHEKTADVQSEDDSDDGTVFSSRFVEDGGRLEFASMFDTVHARPEPAPALPGAAGASTVHLEPIQRNLLTVWTLGVSLGRVAEKERLLKCAVRCFVRFASLLQLGGCPLPAAPADAVDRELWKALRREPWVFRVLRLLRAFLALLPWDAPHVRCLGLAVELTKQTARLLLTPQRVSAQSLSGALLVLRLASRSVDATYQPQRRAPVHSDSFCTPLLQEQEHSHKWTSGAVRVRKLPSDRLAGLWKVLYRQAVVYRAELRAQARRGDHPSLLHEAGEVSRVIAQIQQVLQSAGQRLAASRRLCSVAGEQHFLLGSYPESLRLWKAALWAEHGKDSSRTCFLETRCYLAILYCHLFQYNLSAAQGLCDHLARQVLRQAQLYPEDRTDVTVEECRFSPAGLPREVHTEAALAVVQSMARFMAAYFTNEPLGVLPPHHVDVLPPVHIRPAGLPRPIPLRHGRVAEAARAQQLSGVWTVGYALDLLLIGGLLPEAIWLAHRLGDWKMAVSLGLAYMLYCQNNLNLAELKWRELHLPLELRPKQLFQEKLQSLLGSQANPGESNLSSSAKKYRHFTDSIEEEDADLLFVSVQEILKAAVMAEVDILSQTFSVLMETSKGLAAQLSALVPPGLYLPAPPLYCPQPASDPKDTSGDAGLMSELVSRHRVSGVLQRVLLLLRAARCTLPAAQWYVQNLRRCRRVIDKIRLKASQAPAGMFPEGLLKYANRRNFFRPGPAGDSQADPVAIQAITSFRELCGLCWMCHVREQLSASCRRYQRARSCVQDLEAGAGGLQYDSAVVEHCLEALEWACRLLPFARFMNAEEIVQDLVLSLIGELPPTNKVAEFIARAFPDEEDSVRVPLREKYSSLLKRLRCSTVTGPEAGEKMMTVVIQDFLRMRRRQLKRVVRNIGPVELHLWERTEEGAAEDDTPLYDRLSLGTSLSRSTLTDCGWPLVSSDVDTMDTISDPLSPQQSHFSGKENQRKSQSAKQKPDTLKGSDKQHEEVQSKGELQESPALPVVGSWEFECEDEEYVQFLELFLSYVLEKDQADSRDPSVPFLSCFSSLLREKELTSLVFDVHTTLKRRQSRRNGGGSVFRPGSCYQWLPEPLHSGGPPASVHSEAWSMESGPCALRSSLGSALHFPGARKPKQKGLFGLKQQALLEARSSARSGSEVNRTPSEPRCSPVAGIAKPEGWLFKAVSPQDPPTEAPDPELEPRFRVLGRPLEWMIRWSDRRLLCVPTKAPRPPERGAAIRVKTSAPAVLAALRLLERRYTAGLLLEKPSPSPIDGRRRKSIERPCPPPHVPEQRYTVAPVVLAEMNWKAERESSVDTGYPGSAGTPITILDQEPQHSEVSEASGLGDTVGEMERDEEPPREDELEEMLSDLESTIDRNMPEGEQDLPSEREGGSSPEDGWEPPDPALTTPSISVHIKTIPRPGSALQDRTLKLSDLESPRSYPAEGPQDKRVVSWTEEADTQELPSMPSDVPTDLLAELAASTATSEEVPPTVSTVQANVPSIPSLGLQPGPPVNSIPPNSDQLLGSNPGTQPLPQSDAIRQLLQDEMFRLVQLQQINFMSLMQVVGASFTNLPHLQLHLQPNAPAAQSSRGPGAQPAGLGSDEPGPETAGQSAGDRPSGQQPAPMERRAQNIETDQSNKENVAQNPTELSLHLDARGCQGGSEGLIPASRGLLKTANNSSHGLPLLLPLSGSRETPTLIPLEKTSAPSASSSGLRLLRLQPQQLLQPGDTPVVNLFAPLLRCSTQTQPPPPPPPPPPREAWALRSKEHQKRRDVAPPPAHLNINQYDPKALRTAEEQKVRWAERVTAGPPKHLNLEQYAGIPDTNPLPQARPTPTHPHSLDSQAGRLAGGPPVSVPPQPHAPHQARGLPLLRFHPAVHQLPSSCMLPQILPPSQTAPLQPLTPSSGPSEHYPSIPLLQAQPAPLSKVFPQTLPFQPPRLIPLQQLASLGPSRRPGAPGRAQHGQLQLLQAGEEPLRRDWGRESLKRQKRRRERAQEGRSAGVTFRPEDSIIPPEEPKEAEPQQSELGEGFVIPPGSFDSLLAGVEPTTGPLSTAAELHCFAATKKRPPQIQDASTNTEPVCPRLLADKGTSAHFLVPQSDTAVTCGPPAEVPAVLPPEVFLNLRFPEEPTEPSAAPAGHEPPGEGDLSGRRFINVIDIEDEQLLRALPLSEEASGLAPECRTSPPSNAQLHHMAASVTNAFPPDAFLQETEDDRPGAQVSPPLSSLWTAAGRTAEAAADPLGADVTHKLLVRSEASGARRPVTKSQFAAKLSEMDVQLEALQDVADHMEREFASTRMLVNTIENLSGAVDVGLEWEPSKPRGVQVTEAVRILTGLEAVKEEDDEEDVDLEDPPAALTPPGLRGRCPFSPASASARTSSPLQAASADLGVMPEEADKWAEDTLGLSGLSDIADILGELVRGGGVSASALGLSETQAIRLSRAGAQQRGQPGRKVRRSERERREVREWMRRKQRERLSEFHRQREERRQREHRPFAADSVARSPTSKDISISQKIKEEKDKAALLEHHSRRTREALRLMDEMLTDTVPQPTAHPPSLAHTPGRSSRRGRAPIRSQSAGRTGRRPSQAGQARSLSSPGRTQLFTGSRVAAPQSETPAWRGRASKAGRASRLGLHRPASALPRDRMSQLTRRGMVSDPDPDAWRSRRGDRERAAPAHSRGRRGEAGRPSVSPRGSRVEAPEEWGAVVSPSTPAKFHTLRAVENELFLQGLSGNRSPLRRADLDGLNELDALSDSTGSILSKLDWAAIENMVASEGDVEIAQDWELLS
ncbi:ciliogenesis and planar polarity effector 1 isoform X2 [Lepisosteus oculatus]|uniref:ciliogenesis and planar polarity effector 1 isoform X2 n=1 Tax=Lepisosteus oculatus TaxID=7918 RepID=UPI00372003BA